MMNFKIKGIMERWNIGILGAELKEILLFIPSLINHFMDSQISKNFLSKPYHPLFHYSIIPRFRYII
jgi:hypothetical protein